MAKKTKNGAFIFLTILIIALAIGGVGYVHAPSYTRALSKYNFFDNKNYIAELHIVGVMEAQNKTYNQKWLIETIHSLKEDSSNKGILLYINSPGGGVYQADETYLALLDYKKSTGNPVVAYFGPLAASGGYYVACASSSIYANRNTLTGSIGVIAGEAVDATELLSKIGIKMETITAGKNKNMLNINSPMTNEQRQIMQSIADEAYEQFVGIIAQSRNMSVQNVKRLADGRIYTALQAKQNGLIDDILSFEEAKNALKKQIAEDCRTEIFEYEKKQNFFENVFAKMHKSESVEIIEKLTGEINEALGKNLPYPAYYYKN